MSALKHFLVALAAFAALGAGAEPTIVELPHDFDASPSEAALAQAPTDVPEAGTLPKGGRLSDLMVDDHGGSLFGDLDGGVLRAQTIFGPVEVHARAQANVNVTDTEERVDLFLENASGTVVGIPMACLVRVAASTFAIESKIRVDGCTFHHRGNMPPREQRVAQEGQRTLVVNVVDEGSLDVEGVVLE